MGREWDGWESPAAFQRWCHAWAAECLRVLKPGGYMLAFGGTRTWHRLTCGIEDAGFEIRDGVASLTGQDAPGLMWIHGQGFPKSHDVAKAIDKVGGVSPQAQGAVLRAARERAGLSRAEVAERVGCKEASVLNWEDGRARSAGRAVEYITPSPQYRDALADLLGYTADERRVTGASPDRRGDGSVIGLGHSGGLYASDAATEAAKDWEGWGTALKPAWEPIVVARKPLKGTVAANVLEFGTGGLNIAACKAGSEQRVNNAGGSSSLQRVSRVESGYRPTVTTSQNEDSEVSGRWPANIVFTHSAACDGQCAPDCPVGELDRQSGVSTSTGGNGKGYAPGLNGVYGDFGQQTLRANAGGLGDTGGASRFYPTFRYQAKAPASERPRLDDGTAHETVKSLGLMTWMVKLITRPGGTVLDMFAGSGPVGEVCVIEGFRCVLIEQDPKSAELIKTRLSKPIQPVMFSFDEAS